VGEPRVEQFRKLLTVYTDFITLIEMLPGFTRQDNIEVCSWVFRAVFTIENINCCIEIQPKSCIENGEC
jgi:hypothetical protein